MKENINKINQVKSNSFLSWKRSSGIIMLLILLALKFIFFCFPDFAELFYRNGIYQIIRAVWDHTLGLIPIPWFPFVFVLLLFLILRNRKRIFSRQSIPNRLYRGINFLSWVYVSFLLIWGLNYSCPSLKDKMAYHSDFVGDENLINSFIEVRDSVNAAREELMPAVITPVFVPQNPQEIIREKVEEVMQDFGVKTWGEVRCKTISKKGWMRNAGISGIYFPFSLESYVDGTQSTITHIFSIAHELSHGYGITDEGEANFVAYLALKKCDEPLFQYVAEIEHLSYLLVEIRNRDQQMYADLRANLPYWVKEDLNHIRDKSKSNKSKLTWATDKMNDIYLKSNGVSEGIGSYSQMVGLIRHYNTEIIK